MQNYNAQRIKKKRHILDYMHQPYPCDTMPEGDSHRRHWTSWTDFKAYALNPASPQAPTFTTPFTTNRTSHKRSTAVPSQSMQPRHLKGEKSDVRYPLPYSTRWK